MGSHLVDSNVPQGRPVDVGATVGAVLPDLDNWLGGLLQAPLDGAGRGEQPPVIVLRAPETVSTAEDRTIWVARLLLCTLSQPACCLQQLAAHPRGTAAVNDRAK